MAEKKKTRLPDSEKRSGVEIGSDMSEAFSGNVQ
jgi:hypothetical protein